MVQETGSELYRVDKFVVPAGLRDAFIERIEQTHAVLRQQEGFVRDYILEQESGPGEFNIVTLVEWASADAIGKVTAAVLKRHAEIGFDRQAFLAQPGVKADIASYRRLGI
ncbi:antibiotic biosynthesis monooxygenase [Kaistia dalseonensis]|uniref:Heme-degrading monooxygenase HmoA n=1 Tax=Kaistia dalseonensis TaxID=410840 RepID=A0ABU0H7A8_9HYPH|nr:antibiotic biosynthesis monooxygenase [Kaistia dalseonensis]MCX5495203.1 antibiotic biosynthesis monooxygenase [Kaistia dalseonensis]MDQ0437788.1 heme-degrading monooxygenase HmoA [Kaistia dalseonensis]